MHNPVRVLRTLLPVLLLIASLLPLPAAAQSDPTPAPVYLPVIGGGAGSAPQEISFTGELTVGEEPLLPAPPPKGAAGAAAGAAAAPAAADAPLAIDGPNNWTTILNEGFEAFWPAAGWRVWDDNGATGGIHTWDEEDGRGFRSGRSAWAAGGSLDPDDGGYRPHQRAWMVYGPFDLHDAAKAMVTFQYNSQTELNHDYFGWFASGDGVKFYGTWASGDSGGWRPGVIDLENVPGFGSFVGDSSVWIGFYLYSDGDNELAGPFVDDVFLQKDACPGQFVATWYRSINPTPTTERAVTCEPYPFARNWGSGSPLWTSGDIWSVKMWARVYFDETRVWTFRTYSDDGIRVRVDGSLVINDWHDHPGGISIARNRSLQEGYHWVIVEFHERTGNAELRVSWD